ncbi:hypothetical protein C8R45DRAFT_1069843 [Mycena sanguinolenta]|nr:hypothetical protein C8R45DRAFT_1069843 [Mycena sanguinolenta]
MLVFGQTAAAQGYFGRKPEPDCSPADMISEFMGIVRLRAKRIPKQYRSTSSRLGLRMLNPSRQAMAYVHGLGIVDRNLKLENILLTGDAIPFIKIAGFGLAARMPADGSKLKVIRGAQRNHVRAREMHVTSRAAVEMSLPNVEMLLPFLTVRGGGREFAGERQRAVERGVRRRALKYKNCDLNLCAALRAEGTGFILFRRSSGATHTLAISSLRRDATTTLTLQAQRTPVFTLIHFSLLPVPLTCLMTPPRRSPRKHKGTTEKPVKSGKPREPPLPRIEWLASEGALTWALIAQMEVKENRLVLFGKQEKDEKSVGDNKRAVYKRIGSQIMPEYFKTSPNALAKRVKGKAEDLVSTYKELAKELQVTGGGLENDDDSDDEGNDVHQYLECYISSEGPDHDTTPKARNIWEKLEKQFKFFPALHKFLAARSNIVPPMVATGVGPKGRTVIHLQPPTETQNTINDDCIDPALRAPQTPVPDKDADEPAGSSPITIPSSPSPPAPEEKPSRRKTAGQPSTLQRAVDRAKSANGAKQRPKTFEENLVEIQTQMLQAANAREDQKLAHDRTRLRLDEINQLLALHKVGVLDNDTLAERIKVINERYADPPKRPHSPEDDGSRKKSRFHSSSSDVGSSQPWDRNGSSPAPGSDHSLGYR